MPLTDGVGLARFAREAAVPDHPEYKQLNLMCWTAAFRCAHVAGAITDATYADLLALRIATDFSRVVSPRDLLVRDRFEMRQVPPGAFVAFIEVHQPTAYYAQRGLHLGFRQLVHLMIALGGGWAAGTKNSCIGVGDPVGWEVLDVEGRLNWLDNAELDAIDAAPLGARYSRRLRIRYRDLADVQAMPTMFRGRSGPTDRLGLRPCGFDVVRGPQMCDTNLISDELVITATRRRSGRMQTFVWKTPLAGIREDVIAYRDLVEFLGRGKARWLRVLGHEATPQSIAAARGHALLDDLIGAHSEPGEVGPLLGGWRLIVDADGSVVNTRELVPLDEG